MAEIKRAPIGGTRLSEEQELITFDDIRGILDSNLSIRSHPIPDGMIGSLYTIDGKVTVAEAIMAKLDYRTKLFSGHTKPQQKEEENGKER